MRLREPVTRIIVLAVLAACGREGAVRATADLATGVHIVLDTGHVGRTSALLVTGLDPRTLAVLRAMPGSSELWTRLFTVTVLGNSVLPVIGRYTVTDTALVFRPRFPFDSGRQYAAQFDPAQLPHPVRSSSAAPIVHAVVALPTPDSTPSTTVLGVFPTSPRVPANLLRIYLHFSAPMSSQNALPFVTLLDATGRVIPHAFLPIEANFWNAQHTRYTLFLDPARVKQGLRTHRQWGRALQVGQRYTLVVAAAWRDARGRRLRESYRWSFQVGLADTTAIALQTWTVQLPRAGTRTPLVLTFPKSLDHVLLHRALGIETTAHVPIDGDVTIGPGETSWRFTPRVPWRAGRHQLVALSVLEDPAGNRIDRPFEVDRFDRVDSVTTPSRFLLPFVVP